MEMNFITPEGNLCNFYISGAMIFGMVVMISNIKVLIISYDHTIGSTFFNLGSQLFYLICIVAITNIDYKGNQLYKEFKTLFSSANFHVGNILILGFTSLIDLAISWNLRWVEADRLHVFILFISQ